MPVCTRVVAKSGKGVYDVHGQEPLHILSCPPCVARAHYEACTQDVALENTARLRRFTS